MDLSKYTDEELALMVIRGAFGNGQARKTALGDRYYAVQNIVDQMMNGTYQKKEFTIDEISNAFDELKPTDEDFDELKKFFIETLKGENKC